MNVYFWMPHAKIFIKPAPLGLEMVVVGREINWKTTCQFVKQEEDDEDLPELVPI